MSRQAQWLIGTLAFILIGSAIFSFLSTHELKDDKIYVGYSGEARRNDFLAAQRLLEAFSVRVQHHSSLTDFDAAATEVDALFLADHGRQLARERVNSLLNWVAEGGHLITTLRTSNDESDTLADALGIEIVFPDEDAVPTEPEAKGQDEQQSLTVNWPNERLIHTGRTDALQIYSDDLGIRIIRLPHDNGMVSVIVNTRIFANDNIAEADHAELLWELVNGQRQARQLMIIGGTDIPFILLLIWQNIPETIGALLLLLALWLAGRAQRFGPRLPVPSADRRRILEHVQASGRFLWKHKRGHILIASMRRDVMRHLERHRPDLLVKDTRGQQESLALISGLNIDQISDALNGDCSGELSPDRFLRIIQTLQNLRKL